MNILKQKIQDSNGYTLIEIMMVTLILFFIVGGGVAAYRQFDERQALTNKGRDLAIDLRELQKKAQSGEKPEECRATQAGQADKELQAWELEIVDRDSYQFVVLCGNQRYVVGEPKTIDSALSFTSSNFPQRITFEVISGKIQNLQSATINLKAGTRSYRIEISPVGGISESAGN